MESAAPDDHPITRSVDWNKNKNNALERVPIINCVEMLDGVTCNEFVLLLNFYI